MNVILKFLLKTNQFMVVRVSVVSVNAKRLTLILFASTVPMDLLMSLFQLNHHQKVVRMKHGNVLLISA